MHAPIPDHITAAMQHLASQGPTALAGERLLAHVCDRTAHPSAKWTLLTSAPSPPEPTADMEYQRLTTATIEEHLASQTWTALAIATLPDGTLVDPYDAVRTTLAGELVVNGQARSVLHAHPSSILDGLRLAAQYGLRLRWDAYESTQFLSRILRRIPPLQSGRALCNALLCSHPRRALELYASTQILWHLHPEIYRLLGVHHAGNRTYDGTAWDHTLDVVARTPTDLVTRFAALYHDAGKPDTERITANGIATYEGHEARGVHTWVQAAQANQFPPAMIRSVSQLIRHHTAPLTQTPRRLPGLGAEEARLLDLARADALSHDHATSRRELENLRAWSQ